MKYEIVRTSQETARRNQWSVRHRGVHLGAITERPYSRDADREAPFFAWKSRIYFHTLEEAAQHITDAVEAKHERACDWAGSSGARAGFTLQEVIDSVTESYNSWSESEEL